MGQREKGMRVVSSVGVETCFIPPVCFCPEGEWTLARLSKMLRFTVKAWGGSHHTKEQAFLCSSAQIEVPIPCDACYSIWFPYDRRTKSQPILAPAIGSIGQRRRLSKDKVFSTTVARSSQQSPLPTPSRPRKKSLRETFPTRFGRRIGFR